MGQKVSPTGLRIGVNKDWESKWMAPKKDVAKYLNNDIKIRIINRMQNGSGLIEEMELDVGIQYPCILWRNDLGFVKGHNLTERLQNRLIWGKH